MEFTISQPKWSDCHKRKAKILIELKASNVTIRFDLDLYFSRSNMEFAISQPKMVRLPRNEKQTYRLNFSPQMWPSGLTLAMTLTLNFQGQLWNLLYLNQKRSDYHKRKANILIELQASNVTNGFDLGSDLDLWIFKVKCDLDLWPYAVRWPRIFMVKFWNSCISEWEGRLTLNKGVGSRSFMTMIMTIWFTKVRYKDLLHSNRGDFRCRCAINSSSLLLYVSNDGTRTLVCICL